MNRVNFANPQSRAERWQHIRHALRPKLLLPSLGMGLTTGFVGVIFDLSYAVLIFSGSLAAHLSAGIGLVLLSAAATRIAIALTSSFPGMVADLGTVPTAILAWSVGMVVRQMPTTSTSAEILTTVLVTIGLTSVLTGAVLLLLGVLNLGTVVRSLPYPVLGGFIASTGWLLVKGACKIMTSKPLEFTQFGTLMQPDSIVRWLPGLALALYLLVIAHYRKHPLIMAFSLVGAIALFYLVLPISGTSAAQASSQGWTLAVPNDAGLGTVWQALGGVRVSQIHWQAIAAQWMCLATVVVTTAISLMMNVSSLELLNDHPIDTNRELKIAGVSNLAIGILGGVLSFQSLSKSTLAYSLGSKGRLPILIDATVLIVVLLVGSSLLAFFPKPVLGGLLLFLGLSLLMRWVYTAWFKLSFSDYLIVQIIWLVSGAVGFLQGLTVGWLLASLLLILRRRWPTDPNILST